VEKIRIYAADQVGPPSGEHQILVGRSGPADKGMEPVVQRRRRWQLPLFALAAILPALLVVTGGRDIPDSGERLVILEITKAQANVGTCTPAGTDNLAYGLTGYKLPSTAMVYKLKTASYPSYLVAADVTSAINTSFAAWDAATAKALFTNGGTTTAAVNKKDGTSTVGFGSLSSGTVGIAYAWANSSKVITEFDLTLSTGYQWDLNKTANGDCGGVADKFDVRDVIMHEIGHPTGLTDKSTTADHAQTMHGYAAYKELYKRDLAGGEKKGVTTLYGP